MCVFKRLLKDRTGHLCSCAETGTRLLSEISLGILSGSEGWCERLGPQECKPCPSSQLQVPESGLALLVDELSAQDMGYPVYTCVLTAGI